MPEYGLRYLRPEMVFVDLLEQSKEIFVADRESLTVEKKNLLPALELAEYVPAEVIAELVEVFANGAKKYGKDNWLTPPYLTRECILQSMLRHINDVRKGDAVNPDGPVLHSANAAVNAIFLMTGDLQGWWNQPVVRKEPEVDPKEKLLAEVLRREAALKNVATLQEAALKEVAKAEKAAPIAPGKLPDRIDDAVIEQVQAYLAAHGVKTKKNVTNLTAASQNPDPAVPAGVRQFVDQGLAELENDEEEQDFSQAEVLNLFPDLQ